MATPAADDFDTIRKRLEQLKREADEAQRCRCVDDGESNCPVHRPQPQYGMCWPYAGFALPMRETAELVYFNVFRFGDTP